MAHHNKHIDDLFKQKLGGYSETPPPAVWDALEKRLDDKKDRKPIFWIWYALTSLLVLSAGGYGISFMLHSNKNAETHTLAARNTAAQPANDHHATNPGTAITPIQPQKTINTEAITDKQPPRPVAMRRAQKSTTTTISKPITQQSTAEETAKEEPTSTSNIENTQADQPALAGQPVADQPETEYVIKRDTKHHIRVSQNVPLAPVTPAESVAQSQSVTKDHNTITAVSAYDVNKDQSHLLASATPIDQSIAKQDMKPLAKSSVRKTAQSSSQSEKPKPSPKSESDAEPVAAVAASPKPSAKPTRSHKTAVNSYTASAKKQKTATAKIEKTRQLPVDEQIDAPAKTLTASALASRPAKQDKVSPADQPTLAYNAASSSVDQKSMSAKAPGGHSSSAERTMQPASGVTLSAVTAPSVAVSPVKPSTRNNGAANEAAIVPASAAANASNTPAQTTSKPYGTFADTTATAQPGNANTASTPVVPPDTGSHKHFNWGQFEAGIKAGYETGLSHAASDKVVIAPYIQYNLSSKWALMLQPAIKESMLRNANLRGKQYYQLGNGNDSLVGQYAVLGFDPGTGVIDTQFWKRNYHYSQSYNSIQKSYTYGGNYVEIELPVLLKYKLGKALAIYGGATVTYSKLANITEHEAKTALINTADTFTLGLYGHVAPTAPSISSVLHYNGEPYSNYKGPIYPVSPGDSWRLGYMLGLSYELKKRWMIDLAIQQSAAKVRTEGGYNLNAPLSAPYFRVTLGYKLSK